jgi:hypothetical protein
MPSLHYCAGLFDGEGCVSANVRGPKQWVNACVSLTNTHRPVVAAFASTMGCGTINKKRGASRDRTIWEWVAWHRDGADALERLLPFLIVKNEEAQLYIKLVRSRKYGGNGRAGYSPRERAARTAIVRRIKRLKKREWK